MAPLVAFVYVAKEADAAGLNYRWEILEDGQFRQGHNAPGAVRPAAAPLTWFDAPMQTTMTLSAEQLTTVHALLDAAPGPDGVFAPAAPAARGDLSVLTLRTPQGVRTFTVEDRVAEPYEPWLRRLLVGLVPALAERLG